MDILITCFDLSSLLSIAGRIGEVHRQAKARILDAYYLSRRIMWTDWSMGVWMMFFGASHMLRILSAGVRFCAELTILDPIMVISDPTIVISDPSIGNIGSYYR